ncbi:hypothetical protein Ccrd_006419 [Cynara cardunculus var. scolymus]|uniref:Uncharacterized protein n=1 Tax=Cynara cardunculus var. scolymus TaxID=59895 RepID=A0A103XIT3_CYNCS|nr:hypothetical protein Ccrd_006419 [Cynara cardunculus var. scolymus]
MECELMYEEQPWMTNWMTNCETIVTVKQYFNVDFDGLMGGFQARMQEMKEKEVNYNGNVCKPCSVACFECPICRTKISDRIFAFTS